MFTKKKKKSKIMFMFLSHLNKSARIALRSNFRPLATGSGGKVSSASIARGHKVVGYWLAGCCGMVAGSVVIGKDHCASKAL